MGTRIIKRHPSHLPVGDDHPYRQGAWTPNLTEYDARELEVLEGEVPTDLNGVYLRNTENPLFPALERYHPFDGDGMLHAVHFRGGKADYRNRLIPTRGLAEELAAGETLFAGILEDPALSKRPGWGARQGMKDASSTDVVVHAGRALTTFYQCGDAYACDPVTLEPLGRETWNGGFPEDWGVSAHTKVDERARELLFFSYAKQAPYLRFGVVDASRNVVHHTDIELPGPRLPHDLAFTEHHVIVNDFPLFWDPKLLAKGIHHPRLFGDLPTRFGVLPRRAPGSEVRWFEAPPTYALHFVNAYEDGNEIVLDGYPQEDPAPRRREDDGPYSMLMRYIDLHTLRTHLTRWRLDLGTGKVTTERLDERISEFPMIHGRYGGRRHRYVYAMTSKPGWFLFNGLLKHDLERRETQSYEFPEGVFASESPFAPRSESLDPSLEDAGHVVTLVTDTVHDRSECQIFDAKAISRGPVARLRLPERISSGTHSFFVPTWDLS
ncbi:MAG: carotenoid oxygenase family protein [Myxococcales bacterium]|nr:carotenoid oxygenase family protein [Myxococcales bacterium]